MAINCGNCKKEITGSSITALCQKFHADCFTCQECKKVLRGPFSTAENHPYCIACFAKVNLSETLNCVKCHKSLDHEKTCIKALGAIYHADCLTCDKCQTPIGTKVFNVKNNLPFCDKCFKSTCEIDDGHCPRCDKVMDKGVIISALDKKWHRSCFQCTICGMEIGSKSFSVHENKPYCVRCYTANFSSKCKKCRRLIEGGVPFVNLQTEKYHEECFVCMKCRKSLAGKKFIAKKDHHYCVEHA